MVAGICTLWDDSQDAEEAWKVARAAMNDGWPLLEAALEKRDRRPPVRPGSYRELQLKLEAAERRETEAQRLLGEVESLIAQADYEPEAWNDAANRLAPLIRNFQVYKGGW